MSEPSFNPRPFDAATLRMLDANLNRATEGLRVVEDYCRFALNDQHLTGLCKVMRHDLVETVRIVPISSLMSARETPTDVGTSLSTPQETQRASLAHIAAAAWQRVQQALRVIEECLKLSASHAAAEVEALRYRSYTLAKACSITAHSQERLDSARLYVLSDGLSTDCAFADRVRALVEAGVDVLQLRDKRLDDKTLLARARLLRRLVDEATAKPLVVINDRPDIALLSRADGVHVGQRELSVYDVRQLVGTEMLVGVSTHTIEQARQAVLDGANYIGCGPTFPSQTKSFDEFPGLEFLRQVAAEIALPTFAIGGIGQENIAQVLSIGVRRIAVASAIAASQDPAASARWFVNALRANP